MQMRARKTQPQCAPVTYRVIRGSNRARILESMDQSAVRSNASKAFVVREVLERLESLERPSILSSLHEQGCALLPHILSPDECRVFADLYPQDKPFRSRVVKGRQGRVQVLQTIRYRGSSQWGYCISGVRESVVVWEIRPEDERHSAGKANTFCSAPEWRSPWSGMFPLGRSSRGEWAGPLTGVETPKRGGTGCRSGDCLLGRSKKCCGYGLRWDWGSGSSRAVAGSG
jgi:hypothetical protein